ncbi:hypothetical protein C1752_01716 [Acaryochloris thomasi RCC1774]|uniref:TPM domain-containing protein n=2 Tax=Acaryochloris TaxID=155977 RepID=A0A2W1JJV1_9CYAN|nr:hypothetical protein C1752_01716 [Acaryochloris thomasi RCC1774]
MGHRAPIGFVLGLSFLLALVLPSTAIQISDVVNPRQANGGWVSDQANLLSDNAEAQLNALLTQLEENNGAEVAVVTVPDVAPSASPKAFTTELFNTWGIGKEGQDNGVLVMVSKGDRRVEIETGYGMEAILPDAKVGAIIRTEMIPEFKREAYETGIVNGTLAVVLGIAPDLKLPDSISEPLTQKAAALAVARHQEKLYKEEQAKRRLQYQQKREKQRQVERQRQQERSLAEARRRVELEAEQQQRLPLYKQLSVSGGLLSILGLVCFLNRVQSRLKAAQLTPHSLSTGGHSQEQQLNEGVRLQAAAIQLPPLGWSMYSYGGLAGVGLATLSAGLMGWAIVALMRSQTPWILLAIPAAFVGLIKGQSLILRLTACRVAQLQSKFCRQRELKPWSAKTFFKTSSASGCVNSALVVIGILCFLFYTIPALTAATEPSSTFAPDVTSAQISAAFSLVVSIYLANLLRQLWLSFQKQHLEKQTACRDCGFGLGKRGLTLSEQVRKATLHPESLSKAEAIAIDIGNIKYQAYSCQHCHPEQRPGTAYLKRRFRKSKTDCPECKADTLESETTQRKSGDLIHIYYYRTETCHLCGYENIKRWQKRKPKPKVRRSSSSSSSYSSGSSGSYSSGGSAGGSSGGSSGGSFGGGSSGGGGAGGSW